MEKVELAAFGLGVAGCFFAVAARCLPVWQVSGELGNVTGALPVYWDGVWMDWEHHSLGELRCAFYQSLLPLGKNFRSWQALITSSISFGIVSIAIYGIGRLRFPKWVQVKPVSGAVFLLSAVLLLIPMSWTTHESGQTLGNLPSLRRKVGEALYVGWMATVLFIIGGCFLCTRCPKRKRQEVVDLPDTGDPFLTINSASFRPGQLPCA